MAASPTPAPPDDGSGGGGGGGSSADGGATAADSPSLLERADGRLPVRLTIPRVVLAIALLAILLRRLVPVGGAGPEDEARVAYWIDYYVETGNVAYRRIIHGPLVQHVNYRLFQLFGPSDFVMRIPVALIGGLLPLTALLFREHLRDDETVILAVFLGFNAVLLYYSRFMRSDLLVATFMFAAFGTIVRFYDTRRWRYLYGMAALLALGFASKENAIVYVVTWVGATALLVDTALFRPRNYDTGLDRLRDTRFARLGGRVRDAASGSGAGSLPGRLRETDTSERSIGSRAREVVGRLDEPDSRPRRALGYLLHPLGVAVVFLAITVYLFAPRGAGEAGLRVATDGAPAGDLAFWEGVLDPTRFAEMVTGTLSSTVDKTLRWGGTGGVRGSESDLIRWYGQQVAEDHRNVVFFLEAEYFNWLGAYVRILYTNAPVIFVFGLLGFVYERFAADRRRNLVIFMGYIAIVSIVGYPLGADVYGPWLAVHMVLPLAIPATVLVAKIYRKGKRASVSGDTLAAAAAVFLLVLSAGAGGMAVVDNVYAQPQSDANNLVQWAQPGDDLGQQIDAMHRIGAANDGGTDVLVYYGAGRTDDSEFVSTETLVVENESNWAPSGMDYRPHCVHWWNTLPLPWYFQTADTEVGCERDPGDLEQTLAEDPPPMVITRPVDGTVPEALLQEEYTSRTLDLRAWGDSTTFWIHEDWAEGGS
jgi:predicted membrane-bound mannosyltransferase